MRGPIRALDALLRRRQRIREFCDDPDCLFRIRLGRAEGALAGGAVPAGAPILELHFWNEHLPRVPAAAHGSAEGSAPAEGLGWGARSRRMLLASLRRLARYVRDSQERDLEQVRFVTGVTAFFSADEAAASQRLLNRLGFSTAPYESRLGRFGRFWENVHARLLMWAFNPGALRRRRPSQLRRIVVWMPKDEFVRRYAPADSDSAPAGSNAEHADAARADAVGSNAAI